MITKTKNAEQLGSSLKVMIGTAADQTDLHYSLKKAAQQTESPHQNEEEKYQKSPQEDVESL